MSLIPLLIAPAMVMVAIIVTLGKRELPAIDRQGWLSIFLIVFLIAALRFLPDPTREREGTVRLVLDGIGPSFLTGAAGFLLQRALYRAKVSAPLVIGSVLCLGLTCLLLADLGSFGLWFVIFSFFDAVTAGGVALVSAIWLVISLPRWRKTVALLMTLGFALLSAFGIQLGIWQSPESVTERNGSEIAHAVESYYLERGTYPLALMDLVPNYLPRVPEALTTQGTGWMYTGMDSEFTLGYWDWPDKFSTTVCLYSSKAPKWECSLGDWGPFRMVPTPGPSRADGTRRY